MTLGKTLSPSSLINLTLNFSLSVPRKLSMELKEEFEGRVLLLKIIMSSLEGVGATYWGWYGSSWYVVSASVLASVSTWQLVICMEPVQNCSNVSLGHVEELVNLHARYGCQTRIIEGHFFHIFLENIWLWSLYFTCAI